MTKTATTLNDKYTLESGRVYISSNQALTRLPMDQSRRDRANGLKTAGYISGYRGSPLGVYDSSLWAAQKLLDQHNIVFEPGLNEELAATAIRGTQQLSWFGPSKYDGIFGLWYGKHVGVDRAGEAIKLGNMEGTSATGGYIVLAGDDHGGKSSATAGQSEHQLIAAMVPTLYPSTTDEILEFGIAAWAMSRFSGAYVGLKCITDTLDLTSSIELPDFMRQFEIPQVDMPPEGLNLRKDVSMFPLKMEQILVDYRLPAAEAFARVNRFDKVVIDGERRELGIVSAGKAYLEVRQAMNDLGLDDARCRQLGIRVYKPGFIWPLERQGAVAFASGHKALLVIEEKRPVIEDQFVRYLYSVDAAQRPAIMGKKDLAGKNLFPDIGESNVALCRKALYQALRQIGIEDAEVEKRYGYFHDIEGQAILIGGSGKVRPPFYCSGCPHNTSTRVPEGSQAIAAVGCQGLAAYVMPERRTLMPVGMGADGMPWVSVGKFTDMQHIFQNMGDGTYSHSGILAIRAALAAKANMTFKLLYNDAVAMTGGQPVEMHFSPIDMINQIKSEGVSPILLVSDDPEKWRPLLPTGVRLHHRDELDALQKELRELKGVSAIVYEQTCATEKRRRRKRGTYPDPDRRVFINPEVCEGCGDCSVQSNCVSITPLETEFGRKRRIDQSTCNKDFSCIKGFCPSFVTVEGAKIARHVSGDEARIDAMIARLPTPKVAELGESGYSILVGGIGGTGVLTVGALLGMAAHLEGKGTTILDMTGMAQKGGSVTSHIRIGESPEKLFSTRLGMGTADLILACDMVVGSGPTLLLPIKPGKTVAVVNQDVTPTGEFQTNRNFDLGEAMMEETIKQALRGGEYLGFNASRLATDLIGDSIATNVLMMGYALQKGLMPVSVESVEQAIRLNGTFVEGNLRTFALGRLAAHDYAALVNELAPAKELPKLDTVEQVLESRKKLLTAWGNEAWAQGYVDYVRDIERRVAAKGIEGGEILVRDIALSLGRIMAYKDEYEVARLHTSAAFQAQLDHQFKGDYKIKFHLAPPILPGKDVNGRPLKREFGGWMLPVFKVMKKFKGLRGTPLDIFGYTSERKFERRLIEDYKALMNELVDRLDQRRLPVAMDIAMAAYDIRGYGPVKDVSVEEYNARLADLRKQFDAPVSKSSELEPAE
jgi:indolepyruvate ferredoxin oxidoreductase